LRLTQVPVEARYLPKKELRAMDHDERKSTDRRAFLQTGAAAVAAASLAPGV
jgi:hypothetical protein